MKIGKIISIISSVLIVVLIIYIAATKEGGYITSKEVEESILKTTAQNMQPPVEEKSGEEVKLEELRMSLKKTSTLFSSRCSSCHGKFGEGRKEGEGGLVTPKIVGKEEAFILSRLQDYKSDKLPNPFMRGLLQNVNEDEMKALAKELSSNFE